MSVGTKGGSRIEVLSTYAWERQLKFFLATQRVLAVMDGIAQFLQHHIQRSVLGQFHHEHTGFHSNVARVWLTWKGNGKVFQNYLVLVFYNGNCYACLPQ